MMKAELMIELRLKYLRTEYEPLQAFAVRDPVYSSNTKDYGWIFKYSDIEKVEAIIGTIEIPGIRDKFKKEQVYVPKWKGNDFIEFIEMPKLWVVVQHQKEEDGRIRELRTKVDKTIIERVWHVIKKQQLHKPIKTATVAKNICKELGITRFDRIDTHTFQFDKFFGARTSYKQFYYMPIKVLVHLNRVKHYKKGMIERLM